MKSVQRKLPYDRSERVGDRILQILADVVYTQIEDPRIKGLQLTGVKVTRDLQIARVYYFISGDAETRKHCLESLNKHAGAFRHALAQELTMKFLPTLHFYFDESIERGERIDALISGLHQKP